MTFAQFRRMKPKYQIRLVLAGAIGLALFVGLLLGVSALFSAVRTHLNTRNLDGVTPGNIFLQSSFAKIVEVTGQDDPENLLVLDSRIVYNDKGGVLEFDMNFVNLISSHETEHWLVRVRDKKAFMRRSTESKGRSTLSHTKITFAKYYPALSRVNAPEFLQTLQTDFPVGSGGHYIFEDTFDDSLNPQFASFLQQGLAGYIVSSSGSPGKLAETFIANPGGYVPMIISAQAVNEKKSRGTRVVLQDPVRSAVVLLGVGPWPNL